jgi:hypothetical protein
MAQQPRIIDMDPTATEDLRPVSEPEPFVPEEDDDEEEHEAAQQQTASASDAAQILKQLSDTLVNLYARYSALHGLAKRLNGSPESSPLPQGVIVKKVTVVYETDEHDEVTAEVLNVKRVGEVSELLRAEIERLVNNITSNLTKIREISSASEQACNQAKFYTRMAQSKNVPS